MVPDDLNARSVYAAEWFIAKATSEEGRLGLKSSFGSIQHAMELAAQRE